MMILVVMFAALIAPLLIGMWHRTARSVVAHACRLVLDPVNAGIDASLAARTALRKHLSELSEQYGWSRAGALPFYFFAALLMTTAAIMLSVAELEIGLATLPMVFGLSPSRTLPFGLDTILGPLNPGGAAAVACAVASGVFAVKVVEHFFVRGRDTQWSTALRVVFALISMTLLFLTYVTASDFRNTQANLKELELATPAVVAASSGFQPGPARARFAGGPVVPEFLVDLAARDGRLQLAARAAQVQRVLNVSITVVVFAAFVTAAHSALTLAPALLLAGLICLTQCGLVVTLFALRALQRTVFLVADLNDWLIRGSSLVVSLLLAGLPARARANTDLDVPVTGPAEALPEGPSADTTSSPDETEPEADTGEESHEDMWGPETYDPFGRRSPATGELEQGSP